MKYSIFFLFMLPAILTAQSAIFHSEINAIDSLITKAIMWDNPGYKIVKANFKPKDNAILKFIDSNGNHLEINKSYESSSKKRHAIIHINKWKTFKYANVQVTFEDQIESYAVLIAPNYLVKIISSRCWPLYGTLFYERGSNNIRQIGSYLSHLHWNNEHYLFDNRLETLEKIIFSSDTKIDFEHETELSLEDREDLYRILDSLDQKINHKSIKLNQDSLTRHFPYSDNLQHKFISINMTTWRGTSAYRLVTPENSTFTLIKGKYFHVLFDLEDENFKLNPTVYLLNDKLIKFGKWNSSEFIILGTSMLSIETFKVIYSPNFFEDLLTGSLHFPWEISGPLFDLVPIKSVELH